MSKQSIVAAALLMIGVACHFAGVAWVDADNQEATHYIGAIFDGVSGLILMGRRAKAAAARKTLPVILGASMLLTANIGCASDPELQAMQARELYTVTLETLTTSRELGLIDDETALRIEDARQDVALALDVLEQTAHLIRVYRDLRDAEGERTAIQNFTTLMREFNAALRRLNTLTPEVSDGVGGSTGDPGGAAAGDEGDGAGDPREPAADSAGAGVRQACAIGRRTAVEIYAPQARLLIAA